VAGERTQIAGQLPRPDLGELRLRTKEDAVRITIAIVLIAVGGFLYAGQIVSVVNLGLAQRLGPRWRPS
jgi:hypothetical protein